MLSNLMTVSSPVGLWVPIRRGDKHFLTPRRARRTATEDSSSSMCRIISTRWSIVTNDSVSNICQSNKWKSSESISSDFKSHCYVSDSCKLYKIITKVLVPTFLYSQRILNSHKIRNLQYVGTNTAF